MGISHTKIMWINVIQIQHLLKLNVLPPPFSTFPCVIQIQHLLKLNWIYFLGVCFLKNSNTTLVKVKSICRMVSSSCKWIQIQHLLKLNIFPLYCKNAMQMRDSNTTLVKVKFNNNV